MNISGDKMDILIIATMLVFFTVGSMLTYILLFRSNIRYSARERLLCDLLSLANILRELYVGAASENNSLYELLAELSPIPLVYINGIYCKLIWIRDTSPDISANYKHHLNHAINLAELIARNYSNETWFKSLHYINPSRVSMLTIARLVGDDSARNVIERELKLLKN